MTHQDYSHLARLFLQELDAPARDALEGNIWFSLILPADLQDARVEFTRLFTMSVYAYASVFLGATPELNGESAAHVERFYGHVGFELSRGWMLGAPDALGAELACLAWLLERGDTANAAEFLSEHLLTWAPVCCFAVERNAQMEIYRKLGRLSRDLLMADGEGLEHIITPLDDWSDPEPEEKDLHWVVDHMLAPARCGIFLSKQDLQEIGQRMGMPVGFGDRGLMLMNLLRGAGLHERIIETLGALQITVGAWKKSYSNWALEYPRQSLLWRLWLERTERTEEMLIEMQDAARHRSVQVG
jgi:TorA maturation chaperone TorD